MKYTYSLLFSLLCAATLFGAAQEETFDEVKVRFITAAQNQNLDEALAIHKTLRELDNHRLKRNAHKVAKNESFLSLINLPLNRKQKTDILACFQPRTKIWRAIITDNKESLAAFIDKAMQQRNINEEIDTFNFLLKEHTAYANNEDERCELLINMIKDMPQESLTSFCGQQNEDFANYLNHLLQHQKKGPIQNWYNNPDIRNILTQHEALFYIIENWLIHNIDPIIEVPTLGDQTDPTITQPSFWSNRLLIVGITTAAIIGIAAAICWFKKK